MSFQWTDREVRVALGIPSEASDSALEFSRICTDSRAVQSGDLFLALEGDRFDGHDFVNAAVGRGASGAVVGRSIQMEEEAPLYTVPDTLSALGALARHRRGALTARVVGITGSSGKTGTKELLKEALGGTFRCHATRGNLNNRIGLPLTLLEAPEDSEVLVLEMGTNEPGEIRALTSMAGPEIGVITTVSETHLEKLGSLDGVLEEKLDLLRGLPQEGLAVVGDEPALLSERAKGVFPRLSVTGWGDTVDPEHRPEAPEMLDNGCFRFLWRGKPVTLQVPGRHSVQNALLALAVADALGVPAGDAARDIGNAEPSGMRTEIRNVGTLTLLVDCYNSNPQSLRAALDLLVALQFPGQRIAVLGSMLELGEEAQALHQEALQNALSLPLDMVVATGLFAEASRSAVLPAGGPDLLTAPEVGQAADLLLRSLQGDEVVLLKASRGVAMESIIPSLTARFGNVEAA